MVGKAAATGPLDVICIGRASVDLYGQQIGGRLEDMATFAKSVGGCPANIAIGSARLGLKSALMTRVGNEAMGRFIREQLVRDGVDVSGVVVDNERLTALVVLGVQSDDRFPLIFYRENCADMALCEEDVDAAFIARARAVLITGTHLSRPGVRAASLKAAELARGVGGKVVLDIDYRPNLWGEGGHDSGEQRYVESARVTEGLQEVLPLCDLIVGTEEEFHVAGGTTETLEALRRVRDLTHAALVLKRGASGCVVFPAAIPDGLDGGITGPGFAVEVYNVLGAGDAFLAGFLRGWLRNAPWEDCCTYGNACGALAVSRLLCSPEYPSWQEMMHFIAEGSASRSVRKDRALNHIHWSTVGRRPASDSLFALAIDHRAQMEELADRLKVSYDRIAPFKRLAVAAARRVAAGEPSFGMLLDDTYGMKGLSDLADDNMWIGRPIEKPGSRPLEFEPGSDPAAHLMEWPVTHTVKCLAFYHPDDTAQMKRAQDEKLQTLHEACRHLGRELLIEIIVGRNGPLHDGSVAEVLDHLYDLGIKPDWWKLEPQNSVAAWDRIGRVVEARDPLCRGVVMLGLEASENELAQAFAAARPARVVKGFAVGRTIFMEPAEAWMTGRISDEAAVEDMAQRFGRLVAMWRDVSPVAA